MAANLPRIGKPFRIMRGHRRLLLCLVISVLAFGGLTAAGVGHVATRVLIGWDIGIALYLAITFISIAEFDLKRVRKVAAAQDEGAIIILAIVAAAGFASLGAIVALLGGAKEGDAMQGWNSTLAIATILLSWFMIQTVFALHYAHEFYGHGRDKKRGGLKFPGDPQPDYWDFMYFSYVLGTTFQVSDVDIESKALRHIALLHGVVAFLFNVAILALAVNIGSNLIG
jgi:uncharacterized membrane protein